MAEENVEYNFYILHEDDDLDTAAHILTILEGRGHRGFLMERDGMPGQTIISGHELALNNSAYVIVVISNRAITSGWWKFLTEMALHQRVTNPELHQTVIPLYMPDFDMAISPQSLSLFVECYYDSDDDAPVWDRLSTCLSNP